MMAQCHNSDEVVWNRFIKLGQEQGIIANLPPFVLLAISMHAAWELMRQQIILETIYPTSVLEEVILRTWKAITI